MISPVPRFPSQKLIYTFEDWKNILWDKEEFVRASPHYKINGSGDLIRAHCINSKDYNYVTANSFLVNSSRRNEDEVFIRHTFLVEFDSISLEKQFEKVKDMNMPYTSATYSGNKSIHFLVRLKDPILSKEEFKKIGKNIALVMGEEVDSKPLVNSAGFTRMPYGTNLNTGKNQTLIDLRDRIHNKDFLDWLNIKLPINKKKELKKENVKINFSQKSGEVGINSECRSREKLYLISIRAYGWLLNRDFPIGERNSRWFIIGCECRKAKIPESEVLDVLNPFFLEDNWGIGNKENFLKKEWVNTIYSAYKYVQNA